MSDSIGSSSNTAAPLIHDPDSRNGESLPSNLDEAPTQIKAPVHVTIPEEELAEPDLTRELLGAVLDHFELLDCIGVGGMGRVFRARDTRLDRLVALKVLAPDLKKDTEICRRFEQEAKAAARLDDPHFAKVHFVGEDKGVRYIAMEYVEGENLRRKIDRSGRLDYTLVVNIGLQIARGLAHAAICGVVHRDIKPSNIIVTPLGTAKLVDMGLARDFLSHSSPASEITHAGATLGTFDYISPEQARDPRDADIRSDIYSLGCTMYHALTGRPPFPDGTALQKLLQHQTDSVPDPRRLAPDLPDPVVAVLLKMMAKDPRDRYQNGAELISDLSAVSQILEIPVPEEPGYVDMTGFGPSRWDRHLSWLAPTFIFLVSLGVYGFVNRGEDAQIPEDFRAGHIVAPPASQVTAISTPSKLDRTESTPPSKSLEAPVPAVAKEKATVANQIEVPANADLRQQIKDAKEGATLILLGNRYSIEPDADGEETLGVLLDKDLTLRGASTTNLTTIVNSESEESRLDSATPYSLFMVRGARVHFERLALWLNCPTEAEDGMTTVFVKDGGEVTLSECALYLQGGPQDAPCAMIETEKGGKATVMAERCYFGGGQDGFRMYGADLVKLNDCAFQQFLGYPFLVAEAGKVNFELGHVSLFLGSKPVFRLDKVSNAIFNVYDSVFSRLPNEPAHPLIEIQSAKDDWPPKVTWWNGKQNLYYGFESSFLRLANRTEAQRSEELVESGFIESQPDELSGNDRWPWHMQDPKNASGPEFDENAIIIFKLAPNSDQLTRANGEPIGVLRGPWGPIYSDAASKQPANKLVVQKPREPTVAPVTKAQPKDAVIPPPRVRRALVVDPSVLPGTGGQAGVYNRLRNACDEAPSGSTIELRTNDVIVDRDIQIGKRNLVIVAANGFHPRIRLERATATDSSRRLFQLTGGSKLRLVGVPIDAEPDASSSRQAVLFDCSAESSVELEDLEIALGKPSSSSNSSVFQIRSPNRAPAGMPGMGSEGEGTGLTMRRCSIKCSGALLSAEPQGHWSIELHDSFVATVAPLANVDGQSAVLGDKQVSRIIARQSSFILRDSFVAVAAQGEKPEPPRQVEVLADDCVFLGVGDQPLTVSRGNQDAGVQQDAITWQGTDNFLAGFAVFFNYGGADSVTMPLTPTSLGRQEWLKYWELDSSGYYFGANELADLRTAPFWELRPPTDSDLKKYDYPSSMTQILGVVPRLLPTATP